MNTETNRPQWVIQAEQYLDQAYDHYERDEYDKTLEACDTALELDPDLADAHNVRGVVLEALGNRLDARKAYEQAIRLDPDHIEARENLADLKAELVPHGRLVTIATFSHPTEAYIPKTKLEAAGIWAFVADEYTVTMYWLYSNAIGGVKLQVKEDDVEQALAVLTPADSDQEPETDESDDLEDELRCPDCGSLNISYDRYAMRGVFGSWALSGFIFVVVFGLAGGFPLPLLKRKWHCRTCKYTWK